MVGGLGSPGPFSYFLGLGEKGLVSRLLSLNIRKGVYSVHARCVCASVCVCVYIYIYIYICLSMYLSDDLSILLSSYLSI